MVELTNLEADLLKEALLEMSKSRYQMPNNMLEWRKKVALILALYDKIEAASPHPAGLDKSA